MRTGVNARLRFADRADQRGAARLLIVPQLGPRVPGFVPRLALAVVGVLLTVLCYSLPVWIVIGLTLTAFAAVLPRRLGAWALLLFLGASRLPHGTSPLGWQFLVLLAGLHLLHVIATQTLEIPPRCWVQLAVFRRPLLRFLAVQVPAQLVAALVLLLLAPDSHGHRPATLPFFGVLGTAALLVVTLLLAVPLLRERAR
jgi:hypothetical protein